MKTTQSKQSISKYIRIIIVITVILFSLFVLIYKLDTNYRQKHEAELTIIETYYTFDGWGKNYTYLDTPYTKFAVPISLSYHILPFLAVIIAGIIFILKDPTKKSFMQSLWIPLSYTITMFILQIMWIYIYDETLVTDIGSVILLLTLLLVIINFILFSIINGIIIYRVRTKKVKR